MSDHGTITRYRNHGCRCDLCKAVQRAYVARNRAARLLSGRLSHGKRSAWDAGCRCVDCARASGEAHREYERRVAGRAS